MAFRCKPHSPSSQWLQRARRAAALLVVFLGAWVCAAPATAQMRFTTHTITDSQFGGMRAATFAVPAGWRTRSQVMWDFGSTNYPVTAQARAESPDGSMWIELLPIQVIYWMSHYYGQPIPVGERRFGAVHAPKATAQQAMQHLVVQPLRGRMPGFQIIGTRAVDPSFNPNVGGNPAQTWQRMSPSR